MAKPSVTTLNQTLNQFRPTGTLKFPRLVNAFDGNRFSDGKLTAQINLPKTDPEAVAFVEAVNGFHKEIGGMLPVVKDGDVANQKGIKPAPGHWLVNLKATPTNRVTFMDAGRTKISPEEFEDGDTVRFKCNAYDYSQSLGRPGISLWMNGFQLVAKAESDFDEVEGGWTATPAPKAAAAARADTAGGPSEEEIEADRYTGGFDESKQSMSTDDIIASVRARKLAGQGNASA